MMEAQKLQNTCARPWSRRRWLSAICAAVVAFHVVAGSALAQTPGRLPGEDGGVMQWVVGIILLGLVVVSGFINPKRMHQG